MGWKSERQRSVTFRKRLQRQALGGWNLESGQDPGSRSGILACTALIVPARRHSGLEQGHNWVVLVRNEVIARAHRKMLDSALSVSPIEDGGGSKQ